MPAAAGPVFPAPSEYEEGRTGRKARAQRAARMQAHALAGFRRAKQGGIFPWENQQRRCRRRITLGTARRYMVKVASGGSRDAPCLLFWCNNRSRRGTSSRALGRTEAQGPVRLFQPFGFREGSRLSGAGAGPGTGGQRRPDARSCQGAGERIEQISRRYSARVQRRSALRPRRRMQLSGVLQLQACGCDPSRSH